METGSENERAPLEERVSFFRHDGIPYAVASVVGFYLVVFLLTGSVVVGLRIVLPPLRGSVAELFVYNGSMLIAVGGATLWMTATGRWKPEIGGWVAGRVGAPWFFRGVALGVVMAGLVLALGMLLGDLRIGVGTMNGYVSAAVLASAGLFVAALAEEMLFRGFPLNRLAVAMGRVGASIALAVGFGLVHAANPETTALGLLNVGIASLLLSAMFFTPGGIWAAWGLHFGWNAALMLADAPVSGISFELPGLEYLATGPSWWTGGAFGPEGGLAASMVMVAALAVVRRWIKEKKE